MIVTEDIFLKAAIRYLARRGCDATVAEAADKRDDMENLCEKILALYEVGALPREKD